MASNIAISPAKFARYVEGLGQNFMPAMRKGIVSGAARCIPIMQKRTAEAPPASRNGTTGAVDTGAYKAAWRSRPTSDGARVYNLRPYAGVIDGGRRAAPVGREGIKNLQGWARRKLHLSKKEAKSAAFAIAKALSKRRLKPRKVLSGGIDAMEKIVMDEVKRELKMALAGNW